MHYGLEFFKLDVDATEGKRMDNTYSLRLKKWKMKPSSSDSSPNIHCVSPFIKSGQ